MSRLYLPKPVYDALRVHSEETYPAECCGALLGRPHHDGWRVAAAVRTANAHTGRTETRYEIAPAELVRIQRDAHASGLEIAGFYHSHPDHPPQGSPTDLAEAHWIGCSYVITEVRCGKAMGTNSFRLSGDTEESKRFELESIVVEDENSGIRGESPAR